MSEDIDSFIKHQKAKLAAERDTLDNATSPRENVSLQYCVSALGLYVLLTLLGYLLRMLHTTFISTISMEYQ